MRHGSTIRRQVLQVSLTQVNIGSLSTLLSTEPLYGVFWCGKLFVMNPVSLFEYKGTEISVIYRNGFLGYTFEKDGKTYGNKMKVENKGIQSVASVTFLLVLNFVETYEAVQKI